MSKEVKRYDCTDGGARFCQGCYTMSECEFGEYVSWDDYDALLAERDALRNDNDSMRNAMKNARYRIEQGRVWNGMGWTLTGLHAYQQQVALDEIDAALQGAQP